jgi:hypothetical protein
MKAFAEVEEVALRLARDGRFGIGRSVLS